MIKFKLENLLNTFSEKKINALSGTILFFYLFSYFFMPYKPWSFFISFHSVLLLVGTALVFLQIVRRFYFKKSVFTPDIIVLIIASLFFAISSMVFHLDLFSRAGVQPYILSFICFIFIKFAIKNLDFNQFYHWGNIYLILSGILILLQVNFGNMFYISGFFGKHGIIRISQGWGFADTPTLAGGIMAWFLSVSIAHYSFSFKKPMGVYKEMFNLSAITFGALGLFYTLNRGAWIATFIGIFVLGIVFFLFKYPKKYFIRSLLFIIFFIAFFMKFTNPPIAIMNDKISFFKTVAYNTDESIKYAASVNTRLRAWGLCIELIKEYPVWGIGLLQYPLYYEKIFPQKLFVDAHGYLDPESGYLDPNPRQIPHNSYLYYMTEVGTLPAIPLFALFALIVIRGIRSTPKSKEFPFLIGLITIGAWIGTCDYINERIFWIALASVAGLVFIDKDTKVKKNIKNSNHKSK